MFDCRLRLGSLAHGRRAVLRQRQADDVDQPDQVEEEAGKEIAVVPLLCREFRGQNSDDDRGQQRNNQAQIPEVRHEILHVGQKR